MIEFYDPGPLIDDDLELVLLETFSGDPTRNWVPSYRFAMRRVGCEEQIGRIDLRVGHTDLLDHIGGQIGYSVAPEHRGHHYAARACKLLLPLARRHDLGVVWITCNPDNWASRRTCELAGAQFVEIVPVPEDHELYLQGDRQKCRYRIDL